MLRPVPTYGASASELTPQDRLILELRGEIKDLQAQVKDLKRELYARERNYRAIRRRVWGEQITAKGRQYVMPEAPLVDRKARYVTPTSAKAAEELRKQRFEARGRKLGRPTDEQIRNGLGTDRKLHGGNHG